MKSMNSDIQHSLDFNYKKADEASKLEKTIDDSPDAKIPAKKKDFQSSRLSQNQSKFIQSTHLYRLKKNQISKFRGSLNKTEDSIDSMKHTENHFPEPELLAEEINNNLSRQSKFKVREEIRNSTEDSDEQVRTSSIYKSGIKITRGYIPNLQHIEKILRRKSNLRGESIDMSLNTNNPFPDSKDYAKSQLSHANNKSLTRYEKCLKIYD